MNNITCKYASEVLCFIAEGRYDSEGSKMKEIAEVLKAFGDQVLPPALADMYAWENMIKRYEGYLAA